jgi:hypothetical protein
MFDELMRRAGVISCTTLVYAESRNRLKGFLKPLVRDAVTMTEHRGNTSGPGPGPGLVVAADVIRALAIGGLNSRTGRSKISKRAVYGCGPPGLWSDSLYRVLKQVGLLTWHSLAQYRLCSLPTFHGARN